VNYALPVISDSASDTAVQAIAEEWCTLDEREDLPSNRAAALTRRAQAIEIGSLPPWTDLPVAVRRRVAAKMRTTGVRTPVAAGTRAR